MFSRGLWPMSALRFNRTPGAPRRALSGVWFLLLALCWATVAVRLHAQAPPALRISQLYSSGGLAHPADFVELFNAGSDTVALAGWRIEVATAPGQWQPAALPPATLAPGGYWLVAPGAVTVDGASVSPDAQVEFDLPLGAASVRLMDPAGVVADAIGYASPGEGSPAPALDGSAALVRRDGGCTDTQDNSADWALAPPAPRTQAAPAQLCAPPSTPTATEAPTDTPAPTSTGTPAGVPTEAPTDAPTNAPTDPATATATPLPIETPQATPTATPLPLPTDTPAPPPRLFLSEVMPLPLTPADAAGQWIELHNPNPFAVNLLGWSLAARESGPAVVELDLYIAPGGYLVLGAGAPDLLAFFGIYSGYHYRGLVLGAADRLTLVAPDGTVIDQAEWGGALPAQQGVSLERSAWDPGGPWLPAWSAWPGGQGNLGTPGRPFTPAPLPTATPAPPPTPTPLPTLPTPTATSSPTPWLPPSFVWLHAAGTPALQIDEVAFQGEAGEYVVLRNAGDAPVGLANWSLADAEAPGDGEGVLALPDVALPPGALYVIARDGAAFQAQWGRAPDAQVNGTAPAVPMLTARPGWATGNFALNDGGDELLLLDAAGSLADGVVYGNAGPAAVGLEGTLDAPAGLSLQRVPGASFPATLDQRHRFTAAPPNPFAGVALPAPAPHPPVWLADGLSAAWGSLGARSNFTPGRIDPPHLVAARASAAGFDFLALADPMPHVWLPATPLTLLPAWSPAGLAGGPIVYSPQAVDPSDTGAFAAFVNAGDYLVQGWGSAPPEQVVAFDAGRLPLPDLLDAAFAVWQAAGAPLIPAGNGDPGESAAGEGRFTGLAAADAGLPALEAALRARRGWLTSAPGLFLTLQAELPDGERVWMGRTIAPANRVYLHVHYGDRSGAPARLELWRNGVRVKQVEQPPVDGLWTVALPALPGDIFAALAVQGDGGFALTAPVMVGAGAPAPLRVNEVYPLPAFDGNGDGVVDSDDEFIELYNPGVEPAPLEGWLLSDAAADNQPGRRHVFAPGDYVPGQGHRLVWRSESGVNLNNNGDRLRLLRPDGVEVDGVVWDGSLSPGSSVARLPDGGEWRAGLPPSPGAPNRAGEERATVAPAGGGGAGSASAGGWESTAGQAGGPPGSVAFAKRMGVNAGVEFRATVVVPPGLLNNVIYVGDLAEDGLLAHLGVRVYLRRGEFPALQEGDQVIVRGTLKFYYGELELRLDGPDQIWRIGPGAPLAPLPLTPEEIGESVEGRFVTFVGAVSEVKGDSLYIADLANPTLPPVRVVVARSLAWGRPRAEPGQVWKVTGVVSQYSSGSNSAGSRSGYRVMVRWPNDLMRLRP